MTETIVGPDGKLRCSWCKSAPGFLDYHDTEWGFPEQDDFRLFEKVSLEAFQSGLSWRTILDKRDTFRAVFHHFDFNKIARFTEEDVEELLRNEGIVRNRRKIEATINNAQRAKEMVKEEGSLAHYIWRFEPVGQVAEPLTVSTSAESIALSKDLKKRGWKFVGPTTMYAFMQAMGLVNDHVSGCEIGKAVLQAREEFRRPGT
ncbi:MAG: DNA-3-methyladenine glycosylase I [Candidatus Marinamargulisbacteria bacterium]|jgi:DNA-3-methyladenine glycosylase I